MDLNHWNSADETNEQTIAQQCTIFKLNVSFFLNDPTQELLVRNN
jgi:hypothetical protein